MKKYKINRLKNKRDQPVDIKKNKINRLKNKRDQAVDMKKI